jgi:adenylate cyclase
VSKRFAIQIYLQQQLDFSGEFENLVELGRQRTPDETPFVEQPVSQGFRLAIARLDELLISRRHIQLQPLAGNRIRITNLTDGNTILMEDGGVIAGKQVCDLPLPVTMVFEKRSIQLKTVSSKEDVELAMQSLATPTLTPGSMTIVPRSATQAIQAVPNDVAEAFVSWLTAVAGMLQSSSNSKECFKRATQCLVELVSLDTGAVLLRDDSSWKIVDFKAKRSSIYDDEWRPSSRILDNVVEQKRTFWQISGKPFVATESLGRVRAVIASPILSEAGEVIAILYGDRSDSPGAIIRGESTVTKLEAMLVETLACSVAAGLARAEQERKTMAAQVRFEQFFTRDLAGQLASDPDLLRGRDTEVTIMFCDIRGFSRISERVGPAVSVDFLGSVLNAISDCVIKHEGALIDYIGDEVMAMWGAPIPQLDQARRACQTALDMWARLPELTERWQPVIGESVRVGIGINTGLARVGKTGSEHKFKYGPVGNTVNLASRVQGATKHMRCSVLITAATRARLGPEFLVRPVCQVRVVNISEAAHLYELVTNPDYAPESLCERFEAALEAYHQQKFPQAAQILGAILNEYPKDGPSVVLLSRVAEQMFKPTNPFNPAWDLPSK